MDTRVEFQRRDASLPPAANEIVLRVDGNVHTYRQVLLVPLDDFLLVVIQFFEFVQFLHLLPLALVFHNYCGYGWEHSRKFAIVSWFGVVEVNHEVFVILCQNAPWLNCQGANAQGRRNCSKQRPPPADAEEAHDRAEATASSKSHEGSVWAFLGSWALEFRIALQQRWC
eukprot:CAMPEP_0172663188 /NCGR_PEP_ID=MMETSP1074-20121228/5763_1 /TAXON_ID=2916 /ORGANISM="Ceratium fusus, Strain PA161109" /LENGTH=169 /DNA_ID=CAMNT_0013479143 /DNA_START=12 /DNA_END=521 /DNA_ORIENTATION=+